MNTRSSSKNSDRKAAQPIGNRPSGFWGNLSLARKLLVAFSMLALLALVVGVVANVGLNRVQTSYEEALSEGKEMEIISLHMSTDLLTARQHEKDFLDRWTTEGYETANIKYVIASQEYIAEILKHVDELTAFAPQVGRELSGTYSQSEYEADLSTLKENVGLYQRNFQKTVKLLKEKGFKDTGLEGQLREDVHTIEDLIYNREGLEPLVITMLQIRRREKDYLLRGDQEYIDNVHQYVADFKRQVVASDILDPAEKKGLTVLADQYLVSFDALVEKDVEIAATTQAFHEAAQIMEPLVEKIAKAGVELSDLDVSAAQANSSRTLLYSSVTLVVALLFAVFISIVLTRQITRPVIQLTSAAHALEIGNYDIRTDVSTGDELGTLGSAFNTMASRLKEAFAITSKRAKELQSVAQIATKAAQTTKVLDMLQTVVEDTKSSYDLYHSHIYLLDEEKANLVLAAGAGEPGRQMVSENRTIALDHQRSLVARSARTNQGAISNNVTKEPDFLPHPLLPDTKSEMAIPIAVGDEVLGVIDVQADYVDRFTDEDIAIITTLASQVATAVQNIRQYEQTQQLATQLANEQSTLQAIISNLPTGVFVAEVPSGKPILVNKRAQELLGLELIPEAGKDQYTEAYGSYLAGTDEPYPMERYPVVRGMSGEITTVDDLEIHRPDGTRTLIEASGAPIYDVQGKIMASMAIFQDITERKRNEELTKRSIQKQEALNLITQKIQSATTIESALQVTARELGRALGRKPTLVTLEPDSTNGEGRSDL